MAVALTGGENVMLLHDISPSGFAAIIGALPQGRAVRLAYDGVAVEIMAPYAVHEAEARLIDLLVYAIGSELDIEIESRGSLTLQGLERAAEPDSCFYIGENARQVRAKDKIDLTTDPPPDIVVEIDISRARIDKRRIYAPLGVPEFWRYDGKALTAYRLVAEQYVETPTSVTFSWLSMRDVATYLALRKTLGQSETLRRWRDWLRASAH